MKQIDLTPKSLKLDLQRKKHLIFWVILTFAAVGVNLLWAGYEYWNYLKANTQQQQTTQHYNELQENIRSLIQTQSQLNRWENRLVVLDKMGQYSNYVFLTDFLSQKSPELITLTELDFRREKKGYSDHNIDTKVLPKSAKMFLLKTSAPSATPQTDLDPTVMTLKGKSVNHKIVGDYLEILNSSGLFLKTQLVRSKRQARNAKIMIEFEIKCILTPFEIMNETDYATTTQLKTF